MYMKENLTIAQLRSTIFVPFNIGYTPENFNSFRDLLLPGAKSYGVNIPEMIISGQNPNLPQYGMPWRLFKKCDNEGDYNIVFSQGKIDVILSKDVKYGADIEEEFCKKCVDWFSKILEKQEQRIVTRVAYAPLYAIRLEENTKSDVVWSRLLKQTIVDGTPIQDVNLNYLLKREISFDGNVIQMNLLHSISDGMQIKQDESGQKTYQVVLLQLDLNSIPEKILNLDSKGINGFFTEILNVKKDLIEKIGE